MVEQFAYVDTSALVKHYVKNEIDSSLTSEYLTSYKLYTSTILHIEVYSALARKLQLQEISLEYLKKIKGMFISDSQMIGFIEISNKVINEAQKLVFRLSIKTLDSIHLASTIILRKIIDVKFPLITADKKLAFAAEKEGFQVIKVGL